MAGWEVEARTHNQTSLAKRNFLSLDAKKRLTGLKDLKVRRAETSNLGSFIPTNNPNPLKFEKSETLPKVAKYRSDFPW